VELQKEVAGKNASSFRRQEGPPLGEKGKKNLKRAKKKRARRQNRGGKENQKRPDQGKGAPVDRYPPEKEPLKPRRRPSHETQGKERRQKGRTTPREDSAGDRYTKGGESTTRHRVVEGAGTIKKGLKKRTKKSHLENLSHA